MGQKFTGLFDRLLALSPQCVTVTSFYHGDDDVGGRVGREGGELE